MRHLPLVCVYLAKGSVYRCDKELVCSAPLAVEVAVAAALRQTKSEQSRNETPASHHQPPTTHLMRPLGQQVKMKLFVWASHWARVSDWEYMGIGNWVSTDNTPWMVMAL